MGIGQHGGSPMGWGYKTPKNRGYGDLHPHLYPRLPLDASEPSRTLTHYRSGVFIGEKKKPGSLWKLTGFKVVPIVGIELTTFRLQGGCSTN